MSTTKIMQLGVYTTNSAMTDIRMLKGLSIEGLRDWGIAKIFTFNSSR